VKEKGIVNSVASSKYRYEIDENADERSVDT
jgi:hypothetical protein